MTNRREDEPETDPGSGTGEGGRMGTPTQDIEEKPPSYDQEANSVVSGGGVVGPDDDSEPSDAAG